MDNNVVTVVGLGYVGLPTAILLANSGFVVKGVDNNLVHVEALKKSEIRFAEPGLAESLKLALASEKLSISSQVERSDVFIICVPTPLSLDTETPSADLSYLFSAVDSIAGALEDENLVIIESTCPPGTTQSVRDSLAVKVSGVNRIHLAYCPERILPGSIFKELVNNSRVVGGVDAVAGQRAAEFYRSFVRGSVEVVNALESELVKLVENCYRDVNLAFANEVSTICTSLGVDPFSLISLANMHPRVEVLQPGPGPGGHCIPVDPWFLISANPHDSSLLRAARDVNNHKADRIVSSVVAKIEELTSSKRRVEPPRLVCLGAAYKPDTDDVRESRALAVASKLDGAGFDVKVVDPFLESAGSLEIISERDVRWGSDLVVVLVGHSQFRELRMNAQIHGDSVLDFCGIMS